MFDGFIRDNARWTPRAAAVVVPGRTVTYAELDADVDRLGRGLQDLGVGPQAGVVAIILDDPYLRLVAMAALARLGAASSPGHDPAADLSLDDPRQVAQILAAPARPLPQLELDAEAIGRVLLSSGGRRIGLSWRRIEIANFAALRTFAAGKAGTFVPLTGETSSLGFAVCVAAWSVTGAIAAGVATDDLPGWLEALPPGFVGLTPPQLRRLLDALPPGFQPRPVWRIGVTGAPLPAPLAREALIRLTPDVRLIYDAAASSLMGYGHAAEIDAWPGQVGYAPAGCLLDVVDDQGRPMPDGQSGAFHAAGERAQPGLTGDIGRRLPDGRLILEGRAEDRLDLAGQAFMPARLEDAAYAVPGVRDCAAFTAPAMDGGPDQCWLAVVAAEGLDRDALAGHLAAQPGLPRPRLAWIGEIPRSAAGRIDRTRLREILLSALASD